MFPYIQPIRRYGVSSDTAIRQSLDTTILRFIRYVDTAVDRSEHGTNKRVKTAERYPDGHERTRTDKNGLSNVKILPVSLQREDYQFGIEVLGWKVVAHGNSFPSRGDGFYLRRANSKVCFCPTNSVLSDTNASGSPLVLNRWFAPKLHNLKI